MILISCDNCATVLDAEKLPFPGDDQLVDDAGVVNGDLFVFEDHNWVAFTPCPACAGRLLKPGSLK
jgi:hypothetical protein